MTSLRIAACPLLWMDEHLHVVLVTGRRHGELLLPKGRPEPDLNKRQVAELEAWEEAGVVGTASGVPTCFTIDCHRGSERSVIAYAMEVTYLAEDWPESAQRRRLIVAVDQLRSFDLAAPWRRCVIRLARQLHLDVNIPRQS